MFIKFYWNNNSFLLSGCYNITSLLDTILVPTWLDFGTPNLHFGTQKPPKSCLGGVLGVILAFLAALEGLLERLRLVLGRLEGILDRLGGILGRLGGVLGPLGDLRVCTGVNGGGHAEGSY